MVTLERFLMQSHPCCATSRKVGASYQITDSMKVNECWPELAVFTILTAAGSGEERRIVPIR